MFSDRRDRVFDVPFGSDRRRRGVGNLWVTEASWAAGRPRGNRFPFAHKEAVSCYAECCVVVKTTPTSTFVMGQSEFAFQLLVIAFDAPAQFGFVDENLQRRVLGQGREPIFRWLSFSIRPFNEEPFQRMRFGPIVIMRGWAQTHGGKARGEWRV